MACLDTSTLIDLTGRSGARLRRRTRDKLHALHRAGGEFVTTRFNVAELWVGVERSANRQVETDKVQTFLDPLRILEFEEEAARVFGYIVRHLQRQGTPVGDMDALIAAVCIVNLQPIVTRNVRHFSVIPGLVVEEY